MSLSKYEFYDDMIEQNKSVIIQNNNKRIILPNSENSRQYDEQSRNLIQSNNKIDRLSEKKARQNNFSVGILAALNTNINSNSESDIVSIKVMLLSIIENGGLI
ncbi:MAG: hypothetical protein AB7V56_09360 [Candidatus Nitrosocosmicus sp.]